MSNLVENPLPIFTDINGDPLEDGFIFIGIPGLSPITNPLQAFWDSDLSVPATNIRTKGGYAANSGTPARLYTATNYSIVVQDKNQRTLYTNLDSVDYANSASGNLMSSVENIAALRLIADAEPNDQVSVGGSVTIGDGLMGPLYYWDNNSAGTDNGVSIIKPTATPGNGRWLWINTNAPMEVVNISSSTTLVLAFKNRIFLVDTALPVTSAVPDGDFQGQAINIANRGVDTLTVTGTGIPAGTNVIDSILLTWLGTVWGILFMGDLSTVTLNTDTVSEFTVGEGVSVQAKSGEQLKTKIVDIGDWNMDTVANITVAHGIADYTKIRDVSVMIRNDSVTLQWKLDAGLDVSGVQSGNIGVNNAGEIALYRQTGSTFDNTSFDSTSFNRGWITILYEV